MKGLTLGEFSLCIVVLFSPYILFPIKHFLVGNPGKVKNEMTKQDKSIILQKIFLGYSLSLFGFFFLFPIFLLGFPEQILEVGGLFSLVSLIFLLLFVFASYCSYFIFYSLRNNLTSHKVLPEGIVLYGHKIPWIDIKKLGHEFGYRRYLAIYFEREGHTEKALIVCNPPFPYNRKIEDTILTHILEANPHFNLDTERDFKDLFQIFPPPK